MRTRPIRRSRPLWKPHNYQREAVKFLRERPRGALFLDPGLGKTSITLAAIKALKNEGQINKVLLIAPLRVCHLVWPLEVQKWADFHMLKVSVLHGSKKDQALAADADIYVINFEGIDWLVKPKKTLLPSNKYRIDVDVEAFRKLGFDTLVVDELSKFKHTNTNRFKVMKHILPTFTRRWGLTGSPASNGLMDLFGQCYILDQGRSLGQYLSHYRSEYFYQPPHSGNYTWELQPGAEKRIHDRIAPLVLRMGEELIDMPMLVERDIKVELPPAVMKQYKRLEDDLLMRVDQGLVTAANAATAAGKCRQVASGAIYLEDGIEDLIKTASTKREWAELHSAKLDALQDLVEELQGQPLLVAYEFKHDLERLLKRFGSKTPHIGGGTTTKEAAAIERGWNEGSIPLLFGHPASMGHGLNFQQRGCHVAHFTTTWDYELYDQFNRRVRRQGNKANRVYVYRIVAKGTVDEIVTLKLRNKGNTQNELFQALKEIRKSSVAK